jgi:hypothetical protein
MGHIKDNMKVLQNDLIQMKLNGGIYATKLVESSLDDRAYKGFTVF